MQQVSVRTNVGGRDPAFKSGTTQGDRASLQLFKVALQHIKTGGTRRWADGQLQIFSTSQRSTQQDDNSFCFREEFNEASAVSVDARERHLCTPIVIGDAGSSRWQARLGLLFGDTFGATIVPWHDLEGAALFHTRADEGHEGPSSVSEWECGWSSLSWQFHQVYEESSLDICELNCLIGDLNEHLKPSGRFLDGWPGRVNFLEKYQDTDVFESLSAL